MVLISADRNMFSTSCHGQQTFAKASKELCICLIGLGFSWNWSRSLSLSYSYCMTTFNNLSENSKRVQNVRDRTKKNPKWGCCSSSRWMPLALLLLALLRLTRWWNLDRLETMERGKRTAREEIRWKKRRHATHTTTPSRGYTCCPHFGSSPNKPQRQEEEKNAQSRTHCTALQWWFLEPLVPKKLKIATFGTEWALGSENHSESHKWSANWCTNGANLGSFAATVASPWQTETSLFFSKGTG
jgi:hypothetical protein